MILCVAEKPSAGRDIAKVLGANTRHDGFMEGNGYCVTWTFGHLCALYDPHEYNEQWKGWNMSALPMIPERFSIKVSGDEGVQKQFAIIKKLMSEATEVINCGDPGQEGELIQRWVYQQAGCKIPVKRLWTSSLTEEAIRDAFKQLKDQSAYQHLYEAGLMRAIGDWLLGMNASRAYTLKYARNAGRRDILSIGRVQTPTLALIVKRQQEIEHFVPRTYYELKTLYRDTLFSYVPPKAADQENQDNQDAADSDLSTFNFQLSTLEEAQALVDSIKDQPLTITSVEKKKGTEYAPRLFDLTSLQVECNKSYGYTAEQTLKLIQSLYEKHVTTYPRVDTTYLSEDIYAHVPKTLDGIKDFFPEVQPLLGLKADGKKGADSLPKSKKVFDNKKVTDHHAIIPTGQRPDNLTDQEKKVFRKIALRFIAAFYPDCQVSNTTVLAEVSSQQSVVSDQQPAVHRFKVTGRQVLIPGWREVFAKQTSSTDNPDNPDNPDSQDSAATLPDFVKGEQGPHEPQLKEKTTTPPKYYTEATLLRAMETAGKTVEDEDLRDAMKENGIGRPSTRAAIIEKLFQRRYIERQGKAVHATPLGIDLISKIISPLLMSAELTGRWEKKMRMIERGEYEAREFLAELKQMTTEVVREVKADIAGQPCPLCKQGRIIRGRTRYGCSRWREGCTYAAPF